MINKIILASDGNSESVDTWSNVPYHILDTLRRRGIEVTCVNIGAESKLEKNIIRGIAWTYRKLFDSQSMYSPRFSKTYKKYKENRLQKVINENPDADVILYVGEIPYYKPVTNARVIVFSDFTIEYTITKLLGKTPSRIERKMIQMQDETIVKLDDVLIMFHDCYSHCIRYYGNAANHFRVLKGHFINSDLVEFDKNEVLNLKYCSNTFLFIGRKKYLNGVLTAVQAIEKYNELHKEKIFLNIIGIKPEQIKITSQYINCLGYLSKEDAQSYKLYYDCIKGAKAIINTTQNWGGISSAVEAMRFGTPVITSKYDEFIYLFGNKIDFGYYAIAEDVGSLTEHLGEIQSLNFGDYSYMFHAAIEHVESWTWDNCIEQILSFEK